jgi:hypothetical protein
LARQRGFAVASKMGVAVNFMIVVAVVAIAVGIEGDLLGIL